MGLDMFVHTTPEKPLSAVDFTTTQWAELYYWRGKHPNLHGWMEDLYRAKGGSADLLIERTRYAGGIAGLLL